MTEYAGYGGKVEIYKGATTYAQFPTTSPKSDAVGANWALIVEAVTWEVQNQRKLENVRTLGYADDAYLATSRGWSGKISGNWDRNSTANDPQALLDGTITGAGNGPVYLKLWIDPTSTKYFGGWVFIESLSTKVSRDGVVTVDFSFKGTKAMEQQLS